MTRPRVAITDLTAASALADADLVPVVQSGTTKKATIADFVAKAIVTQGLLSARPAASSVANGAMYYATDTDGGTLYVEVANAWVKIAAGNDAYAGSVLASANPASAAALSMPSGVTYYRIPELTTPTFTMPTGVVTVSFSPLGFSSVSVAGVQLQLKYTTNAWSTSSLTANYTEHSFSGTSSKFLGYQERLQGPAAGDSVQVALFAAHPTDTSITPSILGAFGAWCMLEVRAG